MTTKNEPVMAWHFCDGWKLRDGQPLVVGKTYEYKGEVVMCQSGLHASRKAMDALNYAPGNVACLVRCENIVDEQTDKLVCRKRTVIAAVDAEKVLREFACHAATAAMLLTGWEDQRSWDAIEAGWGYAKGYVIAEDLAAAWAAWAAARAAARAAAWAARAAAWAAGDAAWAAAWDEMNCVLESMLREAMQLE